jgi:hypothetical protein
MKIFFISKYRAKIKRASEGTGSQGGSLINYGEAADLEGLNAGVNYLATETFVFLACLE